MESANKAIIMAFGMLVAVMIMSTIAFMFTKLKALPTQDDEIESVEQLQKFNQEYEVYDKKIMYGVDVISVLNKAKSNNEKYIKGNFLSGNLYNTDYVINIVVHFEKPLEEKMVVTYLEDGPDGIKEYEYTQYEGANAILASTVFKEPSVEYQKVVYKPGARWNSWTLLTHQCIPTNFVKGDYQLLAADEIINPNIDKVTESMLDIKNSKLGQLMSLDMSEKVRNTGENKFKLNKSLENGWNQATWYPAIYNMKTKKFKCEGEKVTYNSKTGRICYMEFTEIVK